MVRAVNPFMAGSSGMALRRFLPYDVLGAGCWATMLLVLGYVFWQSFDRVLHYAERGTLALGITIVVVAGLVWLYRHFREEEHRHAASAWIDRQLDRPALRPVALVVRPVGRWARGPLRFFWHRITPGELGLELTTMLAIVAVGSFTFAANAITLRDNDLVTGDSTAFRWADKLRADALDHVAMVVTAFGSLPAVGVATAATIVLLLARRPRRIIESVALAGALLATWVAVHVFKDAIDRPRPADPLVDTTGQSYPSGHAAYALAWVAIAVVLTRTLPGLARTTAVIVVAVVLSAAIGLTRVYLRAHYFSDVAGGWGLAAAIYAVAGMGALVVAFLRHNGRRA
jgi:undecaprenyl-diphosphatase